MANEYATKPWQHRPAFVTTPGVSTDLIAGDIATQALLISNEDDTNAVRIRFDGQDATATIGILLPPKRNLYFANGEVPSGRVSAYGLAGVTISVAYVQ